MNMKMKKIFWGLLVALLFCPSYSAWADVGVNVYTGLAANQNLFYGSAKNSNQGNLMLLQSRDGISEFILDRNGNFWASSSVRSRNICNQDASYCFTPSLAGLDTTNDSWSGTGDIYATSGNVGIGTTNPKYKLTVIAPGCGDGVVAKSATTNGRADLSVSCGTGYGIMDIYDEKGALKVMVQSNGRTFFNGGNVGIGTDSPNALLQIEKTAAGSGQDWISLTSATDTKEGFRFRTDNGTLNYIETPVGSSLILGGGGGTLSIFPDMYYFNGGHILTSGLTVGGIDIDPPEAGIIVAGDVGIGTTNPQYALDVYDGTTWSDAPAISGTHAVTDYYGVGVAGTGKYIGVSGTCTAASGAGCYGASFTAYSGSSRSVGVSASGATYDFLAAGSGMDYGTLSSIRWKKDIRPIENSLDKVLNLRGVYFNWDEAHGGERDMGMIAEEVGQQVPEIVAYEENKIDAVGMDYSKLTPILVNAIKEQQLQIEELKKEIELLKK